MRRAVSKPTARCFPASFARLSAWLADEIGRARKSLIQPHLEIPEIQDEARRIFARLDAEETSYRERTACIDKQTHELMEAKRLEEAAALLVNAHAEFPEIEMFGALLAQVQSNIEIENEARLLDETERSIRDLARQNQFAEALARLDRALVGRPGESRLRDLRPVIITSIQEQESIAAIGGEVDRLAKQERGADAERALIEGLRKFPSSSKLQDLKPMVDAARKAEWEREAREANRDREAAEIQRMIAQRQYGAAAAALEELNREYDAESGADLAKQLELARQADEQQVTRFLTNVDRLRSAGAWPRARAMFRDLPRWMAEDRRVADRRDFISGEADAALVREEEKRVADQQAAALSASIQEQGSIAAIADEVDKLAQQQRSADAERALIDGLRRFPKSSKLQDLWPAVDAARKAEWEREAREASRKREAAEIQRMIGQHRFRSAAAALEALNREYGAEAGADLAKHLELARQADERQVASFLADVESLRSAETWSPALAMFQDLPPWMADDGRVADARDLVTRQAEAERAREEEQRLLGERQCQEREAAAEQAAALAASIQTQESIAAIADEVERLAKLRGADADRALIDGLRRFPKSSKLQDLRPVVDAARKAQWEKEAREAKRIREAAEIQRMIAQHQLRSATAALETLNREYGAESGTDLAKQMELARQAEDQQVVRFLADVDRLRSARAWTRAFALFRDLPPWIADDSRVAERRDCVTQEVEARRAQEQEQRLRDKRKREEQQAAVQQAAAMVASIQEQEGIAAIAAEAERLTGQQRWDDAKRVLIEGLGRFPSNSHLQELRLRTDVARATALELESREAGRKRETAKIQRMIGQHNFRAAAAVLEALTQDYGAEAGADLAKQLDLARQGDDQQVSHFLADVDRLRSAGVWPQAQALFRDLPPWMAEDSRVADRREVVSREAEAGRVLEGERRPADERRREQLAAAEPQTHEAAPELLTQSAVPAAPSRMAIYIAIGVAVLAALAVGGYQLVGRHNTSPRPVTKLEGTRNTLPVKQQVTTLHVSLQHIEKRCQIGLDPLRSSQTISVDIDPAGPPIEVRVTPGGSSWITATSSRKAVSLRFDFDDTPRGSYSALIEVWQYGSHLGYVKIPVQATVIR